MKAEQEEGAGAGLRIGPASQHLAQTLLIAGISPAPTTRPALLFSHRRARDVSPLQSPSSGVMEMWPNTSPILMSAHGPQEPTWTVLHHIKGAAWGAAWSRTPQSLPCCQPGATELSVPPVSRNPKVPVPTSLTQQDIPQEEFLKSNRL